MDEMETWQNRISLEVVVYDDMDNLDDKPVSSRDPEFWENFNPDDIYD